jgi:HEAT repeat protein
LACLAALGVLCAALSAGGCAPVPLHRLRGVLDTGSPPERLAAAKELARALRRSGADPEEVIALLVAATGDRDRRVRRAAGAALVSAGEDAIPPIVAALTRLERAPVYVPAGWHVLVEALAKMGPTVLPPLVEQYHRTRGEGLAAVATALDGQAVAPLLDMIETAVGHDDKWIGEALLVQLGRIRHDAAAVALIRLFLEGQETWVRRLAAERLSIRGGAQAIAVLRELGLRDPDEDIRGWSADACGVWGACEAVATLSGLAVDDPSVEVRRVAVNALGNLRREEGKEAVVAALRDADDDVRLLAKIALAKFGDRARAREILQMAREAVTAYKSGKDFDADRATDLIGALGEITWWSPKVRTSAWALIEDALASPLLYQALGEVGGPGGPLAAPQQLVAIICQPPKFTGGASARAVEALTRLGADNPDTRPGLIYALFKPTPVYGDLMNARARAAEGLGKLGGPHARALLTLALDDDDVFVAAAAARALGDLGDPAAIPDLRRACRHRAPLAARCALEAVEKLGAD